MSPAEYEPSKRRELRYSAVSSGRLGANKAHVFATKYALSVYGSASVYSLIPKNACATMRLSIALRNGFLSDPEQADWIVPNGLVFRAGLRDIASARYSFVVLRCPYARLASCFYDKFLGSSAPAGKFRRHVALEGGLQGLTFTTFCRALKQEQVFMADQHWRPQAAFLVYREYDDVFAVEKLSEAAATLKKKADLDLIDSRPYIKHDAAQFKRMDRAEDCAGLTVREIKALKAAGLLPHPASIYSDEAHDIVSKLYAEDVTLFEGQFPGLGLFAAPGAVHMPSRGIPQAGVENR